MISIWPFNIKVGSMKYMQGVCDVLYLFTVVEITTHHYKNVLYFYCVPIVIIWFDWSWISLIKPVHDASLEVMFCQKFQEEKSMAPVDCQNIVHISIMSIKFEYLSWTVFINLCWAMKFILQLKGLQKACKHFSTPAVGDWIKLRCLKIA